MTDLYAFSKPGDPAKSILIFNVHPSMAVNPVRPTTREAFAPGALYEIKIDTDGDAIADLCFSVRFASSADGTQTATLRRVAGPRAAGVCDEGDVLVEHARVSVGQEPWITDAGDYRCFFGWRSDPFFFDANGLFNEMQFTGADFFADQDVCSIVLELPNSVLPDKEVGIWARTLERDGNEWIQADRGGRPLQTVFLAGEAREAYLSGQPADDARFVDVFAHELKHTGGYTREEAIGVARQLLPDILSYDPRRIAAYPDNGRTLTDDVVDHFFAVLTNGKVTGDKVGPHADLLDVFPYLGPPHN